MGTGIPAADSLIIKSVLLDPRVTAQQSAWPRAIIPSAIQDLAGKTVHARLRASLDCSQPSKETMDEKMNAYHVRVCWLNFKREI